MDWHDLHTSIPSEISSKPIAKEKYDQLIFSDLFYQTFRYVRQTKLVELDVNAFSYSQSKERQKQTMS